MSKANLQLLVKGADGTVKASSSVSDEVSLVYLAEYAEGDTVTLTTDQDTFLWIQLDDAMGRHLVYLKKPGMTYEVPFGEKKFCYSPKIFSGDRHLMTAWPAKDWEIAQKKNLALNPYDQHENGGCYPHASANVETRGESVFAAKNAINGNHENHSHGFWPFESWGINRNPEAQIKVEFGRKVKVDELAIFIRCDFPHDNWWIRCTVTLSDGTKITMPLEKTDRAQILELGGKEIEWFTVDELIKADDPSPFPALSAVEAYGTEA